MIEPKISYNLDLRRTNIAVEWISDLVQFYSEIAGTCISFAVFWNLRFHFISSRVNKPKLLLDVSIDYSSHRKEELGKLSRDDFKYFSIKKNKVWQEACNVANGDTRPCSLIAELLSFLANVKNLVFFHSTFLFCAFLLSWS